MGILFFFFLKNPRRSLLLTIFLNRKTFSRASLPCSCSWCPTAWVGSNETGHHHMYHIQSFLISNTEVQSPNPGSNVISSLSNYEINLIKIAWDVNLLPGTSWIPRARRSHQVAPDSKHGPRMEQASSKPCRIVSLRCETMFSN